MVGGIEAAAAVSSGSGIDSSGIGSNPLLGSGAVVAEATAVVEAAARARHERGAALHQEWHAQVFERLQGRIRAAAARRPVAALEAALRGASDAYVAATNARPRGVFLADAAAPGGRSPGAYDALAPRREAVRVPAWDLDLVDPVKRDLVKAQAERDLLQAPLVAASGGGRTAGSPGRRSPDGSGSGIGGGGGAWGGGGDDPELAAAAPTRLAPAATRETLAATKWGALQIGATPACHCIGADGAYRVRPPQPAALAMGASRVALDDFAPPAAGAYRPGKRAGGGRARVDHLNGILSWR